MLPSPQAWSPSQMLRSCWEMLTGHLALRVPASIKVSQSLLQGLWVEKLIKFYQSL